MPRVPTGGLCLIFNKIEAKNYHQLVDEIGHFQADQTSVGRCLRVQADGSASPADDDDVVVSVRQQRRGDTLTMTFSFHATSDWVEMQLTVYQFSSPVLRKPWTTNLVGRLALKLEPEMVAKLPAFTYTFCLILKNCRLVL
jgi:hypothetical protein